MKKIFFSAAALAFLGMGSVAAQDIYKVEQFSSSDLNGDARFVGMGGAMSSLGANLSAMGSNPASTALYRRGDMSFSFSTLSQNGNARDADYLGGRKNRLSFDQAGFVYTLNVNDNTLKFVNFGFGYKKSRNLHQFFGLNHISLAKGMSQSLQMRDLAQVANRWLDLEKDADRANTTPVANLGYDVFMIDPVKDADGKITDYKHGYAEAYHYGRAMRGAIEQYDFNVSFNLSDRYYLGVNIGLYNLHSKSAMEYEEASLGEDGAPFIAKNGKRKTYLMQQEEVVSGTGVDAKFGFIARPFAESPFRLGLAITTPTFYNISTSSDLALSSPYGHTNTQTGESFEFTNKDVRVINDYYMRTPWKVNFSLGTTFNNVLAVGAEYEIADYLVAQTRYLDNSYDIDDWNRGVKDKVMQYEIDNYMRDVHTLRLGAELRLSSQWFGRAGYNFVSSPFKKEAFLNLYTDSPSYQYATNTDYVNLGSINRYTLGLGYRGKNFYADAAYQFQSQDAEAYPFHYNSQNRLNIQNDVPAQTINLKRNSFLFTVGYRF